MSRRSTAARRASNGADGARSRPIRLFFDARYIRTDFHDGISRFSAELAGAVFALAGEAGADRAHPGIRAKHGATRGVEVIFLIHDEAQTRFLPAGARTLRIHAPTSPLEPFTALRLNRHRPDAVFSPMQTIGSLGRRFKLILTLHDTIYYRHRTPPRNLPAPVRLGWRIFHLSYTPQRLVLNRADTVATVSETSKSQFARVRLTKRPVLVISNAPQRLADLLPGEGTAARGDCAPRNIVYMGSFMPYKNVETLVRAMGELPEHTLHLLSRITPTRRAEYEAMMPEGANVVFHGGVSDEEYARLLADRAILATLSLDEGYGLPVAEALALGVPAVVSELEIFREVAGAGALFVPAQNAHAFAEAVRSLDDDALRAQVIEAGLAHAQSYSWERSAEVLLEEVRRLAA